jgi:hypothetical protein
MAKINFDYHKGMLGVLSMLKTIADGLEYASLDVLFMLQVNSYYYVELEKRYIHLILLFICRGQGKALVFCPSMKISFTFGEKMF